MSVDRYPNVFRPFAIGNVEIRNRIFLPAHTTNFAENFLPTARHLAYLRERAAGGVGLMFMDPLRVHRTSLGRAGGLAGPSAESLPLLREITDALKAEGARVFTQVTHTGRHSDNFSERLPAWGPSPTPWTTSGEIPHQMTRAEMTIIRDCYVETALFALEAGFEGMEIHFGHGHLLHQFLSPACNQRTDDYGGSFEARLRFPMEVFDAVLSAVGDRAPVGARVSVADLMEGGCTDAEMREIVRRLAAKPGCKFVHMSVAAYHWPSIGHHVADMSYPSHPFLDETLRMTELTGDLPVLAVNRYRSLADAEDALATGAVHMVGMNRAHMADPRLVQKTLAGEEDRVRPCISSNHCIGQIALHRPISCMMNARVGKEALWPEVPVSSTNPQKVLVIGGGPAGMEAARIAALAGHSVTLWEAADQLGGKLILGGTTHRRGDLSQMRQFLEAEVRRTNATIVTSQRATPEAVAAFGADRVILAIGSIDDRLPEGISRTIEDALADTTTVWQGRHIAIVDKSGSWASLAAAETLAHRGAKISVISSPDSPLWDVNIYSRMIAMERLSEAGVQLRPGMTVKSIALPTLELRNKFTGQTEGLERIDEVLFASRGASAFDFQSELEARNVPVTVVGDALAPHTLFEALHDAQAVARAL